MPHYDRPSAELNPLVGGYRGFARGASNLQSAVLLLLRLAFGWKMYLSGYRHLHHVDDMVETFRDTWHIPFPRFSVYMSGWTELLGGALLMAGLATRVVSIPLVFNFLVAILTAGKDSVAQALKGGQILPSRQSDAGRLAGLEAVIDDTAFPFLMVSLAIVAFGPGKASVDYLLQRLVFKLRDAVRPGLEPGEPAVDTGPGGLPTSGGPPVPRREAADAGRFG